MSLFFHLLITKLVDRHGFASRHATKTLINQIKAIKPDIIQLHNLHGYYLNVSVLFKFLKTIDTPVFWTFHDCWPVTGHCTFFDSVNCEKWKTLCHQCPKTNFYPASIGLDNSKKNYLDKKQLFNGLKNLHLITPSRWLSNIISNSYLNKYPVDVIHNGVDLATFKPIHTHLEKSPELNNKKVILGVASTWDERKGLKDFIKLHDLLPENVTILLIGLSHKQLKELPKGMIGIARTENIQQLVEYYNIAEVFVNPTQQDNFPTTNIEALACGTPVITYKTGGSTEAIDESTGIVVERNDLDSLLKSINLILSKGKTHYSKNCRNRAVNFFKKEDRYQDYLTLYQSALKHG